MLPGVILNQINVERQHLTKHALRLYERPAGSVAVVARLDDEVREITCDD